VYAPCSGKALFLAATVLLTSIALGQESAILNARLEGAAPKPFYSVTRKSSDGTVYLKLVNASSTPQLVRIQLDGAKGIADGKLITLPAKTTAATNSITQPAAIVPVESGLRAAAPNFTHTVPGYAIQVLELKT
jgi:alpha-N-arabinofuranosidase